MEENFISISSQSLYECDCSDIQKLKEENSLLKIKLMNALNEVAVWKASEKGLRREIKNNE